MPKTPGSHLPEPKESIGLHGQLALAFNFPRLEFAYLSVEESSTYFQEALAVASVCEVA